MDYIASCYYNYTSSCLFLLYVSIMAIAMALVYCNFVSIVKGGYRLPIATIEDCISSWEHATNFFWR